MVCNVCAWCIDGFARGESMASILIVDDTASIRHLVKAVLKREGHTVSEAREGQAGLEQATAHPPDLLILDVGLPDISGIDVAKQLRQHPLLQDMPILMLTGLNSTDNVIAGLQVADDYVTKPFEKRELLARIEVLLRRHHDDKRLKGRLEQVGGAATLLQTVAKSGSGGLVFDDGSIVYFEKGFVVHAEHHNKQHPNKQHHDQHSSEPDDDTPMAVLRGVFNREEGAFHVDPSLRPVAKSMAREPTALLLEVASHYDEVNRDDMVAKLNTAERLIANQDMAYQQGTAHQQSSEHHKIQRHNTHKQRTQNQAQNHAKKPQPKQHLPAEQTSTPAEQTSTVSVIPAVRKPRHVDISNLTLSSLAVVESLAEALSYIEGLHGKQSFRVSEHIDPDTQAPYLLFDSGDVKIVAQKSRLHNISTETSELLKLELLD